VQRPPYRILNIFNIKNLISITMAISEFRGKPLFYCISCAAALNFSEKFKDVSS
jgi:hypothetical protein